MDKKGIKDQLTPKRKQGRPTVDENRSKRDSLTIRISGHEKRLISLMARRFADGDVSKWLRFAAINFNPESKAV